MNLIIGSTSQLSHYFPDDYLRLSSRNIDLNYLKNQKWQSIYITFAEQRIYNNNIDYINPNYFYTLNIINSLIDNCDKIVCYGSCMLWEKLTGTIDIKTVPNFYLQNKSSEYTISKLLLWNKINQLKIIDQKYNKVIFLHPFYFNSVYRSQYFLFGKIFDSIINHKKVKVNNLDFNRDMVSPQFIVEKSLELKQDALLSSGNLFNVKTFIKDLYHLNNMNYNDYLEEDLSIPADNKLQIVGKVNWNYNYENLLKDTQNDILTIRKIL